MARSSRRALEDHFYAKKVLAVKMNEIQLPAIPQMNLYVVDQRNKIQTRTHI